MTDELSLVTVVGNPKPGSRTLTAASALAGALAELVGPVSARVFDLAPLGAGLLTPWALSPQAADAVAAVRAADVLVLATPTYKASFTGLLKLLLDILPAGSLGGTVVVPLTVSAGPAHRHLADWQLRPVLGELGAVIVTPSLLLAENQMPAVGELIAEFVGANGRKLQAAVSAVIADKAAAVG